MTYKARFQGRDSAHKALGQFVAEQADRFKIPGVAVAVLADGSEHYACHGITSTENPLPVDRDTLFVTGSITKTFTATAIMRLVSERVIALDAPVARYVPELKLADTDATAGITVLNLLNHTSGLDWGVTQDTGEGDDALARYVALLGTLKPVAPVGTRFSYSQAGYNLLGRVIEEVTGKTYEDAIAALLLEPLGLSRSFFMLGDIMTRRYAVGHNRDAEGNIAIARLWRRWRGENPGGGLVASVTDLLHWARFHIEGSARDGRKAKLSPSDVGRMREPTVRLRGSNLGDAVGLGWFLRRIEDVPVAGHTGSASGQFSDIVIAPNHGFAVATLANAGPDGILFNRAVIRWSLEAFLGVVDRDPEPVAFEPVAAAEVVGDYQNDVMTLTIRVREQRLWLEVLMKPEIRLNSPKQLPPDHEPFQLGFLPGDGDEYMIVSGAFEGQRGYFTRNNAGSVVGVDLAGRLFGRARHAN